MKKINRASRPTNEGRDDEAWKDFQAVGGDTDDSIRYSAGNKGNSFSRRTPSKPMPANTPDFSRKQEATPFGGQDRRMASPSTPPPTGGDRRRARTATSQFQIRPDTPLQKPTMGMQKAQTEPGEHSWDVYVDGGGVYKVPAPDEETAKTRAAEWINSGGDPDLKGRKFSPTAFQAVRGESTTAAAAGPGPQRKLTPEGMKLFREMVNARLKEIVRKKEGGGGYNLYSPNKGKKKNPKPVGEFPTRTAAKRAELARFPPKDPEQLKRARKRLEKLAKDPKKRQDKERKELSAKKPKVSGKSAGERKTRKEEIVRSMAAAISERLFREEEVAGSPWDEKISNLHPDALGSDKKLHRYLQGIESSSTLALGDGHKALAKALRGMAKVMPGDVMRDPDRRKMYMPISLDVGGSEIGPVHLYVDGGNLCIEISPEAREMIGGLDPSVAKDLRGGLMSFQEDHLPKIDRARKAWTDRDTYLDKLHQKLEKSIGGMSAVELHLARQMMNKRRR